MSEGELKNTEEQNTIDEYEFVTPNPIAMGTSTVIREVTDGGATNFAIKLLLPDSFKDSEQKQVLKREAKIGKSFDHPNLIRIHKIVMTKQHGYLVMDYFRGLNLKAQIGSDLTGLQGRFRKLVDGLCLALGHMHNKGWVHKDVKPDNILFNKSSELKVIDYSLSTKAASALSKLLQSKNKMIQGTRTYIAPETLLRKPETPQTDMYSLGITLFEILTGTVPFTGTSPADLLKKHVAEPAPDPSMLNPNVTPEMDRFITRLLAKNPKKRHSTMEEVHAEFRSLQPFKEDVHELAQQWEAEERQKHLDSIDKATRLDSRADALKAELIASGELVEDKTPKKPAPKPVVIPPQPQQAPPMQQQPGMPPQPYPMPNTPGAYHPGMQPPMPQQPGMPPQQYPQQPGMPPQQYPQQPMPGMMPPQPGMYPQQMPPQGYPGAPMPPGYPAGMPPQPGMQPPMPQQPGMPPQQPYPPQGAPAAPPQQPAGVPQQQAPAAPVPQPAPQQQPPTPAPQQPTEAASDNNAEDDLPFMDELPDIF